VLGAAAAPGWNCKGKGHSKKKVTGPYTKRRPRKKKNGGTYLPTFSEIFLRFSGLILENTFMVFLGSSCRETAKNAIKKMSLGKDERKKVFYGVFELPLLRNAQKRHTKISK
jgi:hypothetical protein